MTWVLVPPAGRAVRWLVMASMSRCIAGSARRCRGPRPPSAAAIGLLAGLVAAGPLRWGAGTRVFVFVGILGGFTTFPSFGLDTLTLVRDGAITLALRNVAAQVMLALGAGFAGYWIAR